MSRCAAVPRPWRTLRLAALSARVKLIRPGSTPLHATVVAARARIAQWAHR